MSYLSDICHKGKPSAAAQPQPRAASHAVPASDDVSPLPHVHLIGGALQKLVAIEGKEQQQLRVRIQPEECAAHVALDSVHVGLSSAEQH